MLIPRAKTVILTCTFFFHSGECLVCSLKLCEQISTSNQGLLLFECGKLTTAFHRAPTPLSGGFTNFLANQRANSRTCNLSTRDSILRLSSPLRLTRFLIGEALRKTNIKTCQKSIRTPRYGTRHCHLHYHPQSRSVIPASEERIKRVLGRERVN